MDRYLSRRREQLYKQLLTNASKGLNFSQDVMWEMGPDNIPYSEADFSWLFCASGPLAPSARPKSRKQRGIKWLPHHTPLRSSVSPHHHPLTTNEPFFTEPFHQDGTMDSVKSIGLSRALNIYSINPSQFPTILEEEEYIRRNKGNEFVLKKPKKNTAHWVVRQQIPTDYQNKAWLPSVLKDKYGSASATDQKTDESKGKKDFCGFYSVPKSSTEPRTLQSSKPETPLPVYYRQVNTSYSQHCCSTF